MAKLAPYRKLVVALIGTLVVFLQQYYGVNSEIVVVLISLATALGVYSVPNEGVK